MEIEIPLVKVRIVVEGEIEVFNNEEVSTLETDLINELMKVKSGYYENRAWGNIVSVEKLEIGTTTMEVDDDDLDDTEGSSSDEESCRD